MRIVAHLALAALALPPWLLAEGQAPSTDRVIASHRAEYNAIVKEFPTMRRVEADMDSLGLERMSTEGGTLEAYCSGNELRLVIAHYNGEYGRGIERFYYKKGALFFVLDRREFADRLYGPAVRKEEERLYLTGPKLVRWLGTNGRPRSLTTPAALERVEKATELGALFDKVMSNCRPRVRTG